MFQPRNRQDQAKRSRRPIRQPLALEILEDRTLLSAVPTTVLDLNGLAVTPNHYSSTDILVRFQAPPGTKDGPALVAGTALAGQLPLVPGLYEVNLSGGMTVAQALAAYRAEHGVLDAEPDYHLTVSQVPNDPLLSQQWSLHNTGQNGGIPGADIHAEQAWDVSTGSPSIVVAIMDTGLDYNHTDLYPNIWLNQAEMPASRRSHLLDIDHDGYIGFRDLNNPINWGRFKVNDVDHDGRITAADILAPMVRDRYGRDTGYGGWAYPGNTQDGDLAHPNDFIGWNFVSNTNNPYDDNGHGTNVAGILGAIGNNATGVAGIDWNVQIMPVKFIGSDGDGSVSNFILGLDYAIGHGARITNNSWEGAPYSQVLYGAISDARLHRQIFVAAAGNEGSNNDYTPDYPASFSQSLNNVVAVAATNSTDHLASFSNYGAHSVALAAPGVGILSTLPGNRYGFMSGTSMATPEVTGAMALVWGLHPNWSYTQVIDQVLNTTDRLASLQGKVVSGGRLDLAAAVGWNLSTRTTPTVTSIQAKGPTCTSMNSLRLTFNEPIDVSSFTAEAVKLAGSSGRVIPVTVRVVNNSGDREMALVFPNQAIPGHYILSINSSVRDLMGSRMNPFQAIITLHGPQTYTDSTAAAIQPWHTTAASIRVPEGTIIGSIEVRLNIRYPRDGDLYAYLIAPNGETVALVKHRGGSGANFQNTVLSEQAATAIDYGQAPFAGRYRPASSQSQLHGMNSAGTWKLMIKNTGGHSGTLVNWSLIINPDAALTGIKVSSFGDDSPARR